VQSVLAIDIPFCVSKKLSVKVGQGNNKTPPAIKKTKLEYISLKKSKDRFEDNNRKGTGLFVF